MDIPYNKVSREKPTVEINVRKFGAILADAELIVGRVGDVHPFAAYPATLIQGDATKYTLRFTFDELLFSKAFGRYSAVLMLNGRTHEVIYFQYENVESTTVKVL